MGEGSLHGRINRFPEQLLSEVMPCFALLCCASLWNLMLDIEKRISNLTFGWGDVPWAHTPIPRIAAARSDAVLCFAVLCFALEPDA